jgi:hypothetical protein
MLRTFAIVLLKYATQEQRAGAQYFAAPMRLGTVKGVIWKTRYAHFAVPFIANNDRTDGAHINAHMHSYACLPLFFGAPQAK